jgi:hypothetical protein
MMVPGSSLKRRGPTTTIRKAAFEYAHIPNPTAS